MDKERLRAARSQTPWNRSADSAISRGDQSFWQGHFLRARSGRGRRAATRPQEPLVTLGDPFAQRSRGRAPPPICGRLQSRSLGCTQPCRPSPGSAAGPGKAEAGDGRALPLRAGVPLQCVKCAPRVPAPAAAASRC